MSQAQIMAAQLELSRLGASGTKEITGTSKVSPTAGNYFMGFTTMAATVVASQEDMPGSVNGTLSSFTSIPANTTIYGKFKSITLTSGQAIGYYAKG